MSLKKIIEDYKKENQKYPNQSEIVSCASEIAGRNKIIEYLNEGEGKYWNMDGGKGKGGIAYIPLGSELFNCPPYIGGGGN